MGVKQHEDMGLGLNHGHGRRLFGARWAGVVLEHEATEPVDLGEECLIRHCVAVNLGGPARFELRMLDERFWSAKVAPLAVTILPAGAQLRSRTWDPSETLVLSIEPQHFQQACGDHPGSGSLVPCCNVSSPLVAQLLLALHADAKTGQREGASYAETLVVALVAHLRQMHTSTGDRSRNEGMLSNVALRRIQDHIRDRIETGVTLASLAALLDMDSYAFLRSFKRSIGMTPHQYLIRARIEHAKEMLHSTRLPVTDIALRCGFASSSHFADTFKKVERRTALEYRNHCTA